MKKLSGVKITEGRCSYEALDNKDKATGHKSHGVASEGSAPRRIDKPVNHSGNQHAVACQKKTEPLFKQTPRLTHRQIIKNLAAWIDPITERTLAFYKLWTISLVRCSMQSE